MSEPISPKPRNSTAVARAASEAARIAKKANSARFGDPEVFITKAGERKFAWELRRFGGLLIRKSDVEHPNRAAAEAAGADALEALRRTPGLPVFEKQLKSRAEPS